MEINANVQSTAPGRGHPATAVAAPDSLALEPQLHRVERVSAGLWRDAGRRLVRDRAALTGLAVVVFLIVVAIIAPLVTPHPPNDQSFRIKLEAPSSEHLLGTDEFGRDVFSRILIGTRVALGVGIVPVVIALIVGVSLGLVAG